MTQREIIRNNLNKSDWEITKDKCDSTRAHRRHLAANGKHENKRKIYCTNVHLRIIEILITLMYKLSAVTAAVTEATTLLPPDHDAPTPASEIQIDARLPTGFYYVRDVISESQEETVKEVLHENTWEKYHGRSVQHFGHAYLGPSKVTATSHIPEEFSSIIQTYNAALERLGLSHPPPNQITGTMYLPGEGIGYHRDDPLLGNPVSIFGSQSDTTMFFKNPSNGDSFRIRLFARFLLVLTGAARREWHHGIPRRREDEVFGLTVPRTIPRLALILRHIPQAS